MYCFVWATISAMYPVDSREHPKRCSSYKTANIDADIIVLRNNIILKLENLNFLLALNNVKNFGLQNPKISVNLLGPEDNLIEAPYYFIANGKTQLY